MARVDVNRSRLGELGSRLPALVVDLSTVVAIALLISGGIRLRDVPLVGTLRWTTYGPLFAPLALCLVFGFRPPHSRVLPALDRLRERVDALPPRTLKRWVRASIAIVCAAHGVVVYLRYFSFRAGMDLAIYANACRGALYSTMKGDVWLFADHFEPALLLFTPLCRVVSPALALLTVQLFGFAIGAYGIFALARARSWSGSYAWLTCALYLLFSGNVTIVYYDFHLLALTLGLVPWLWYALEVKRYGILVCLGLLYLGLKESVPLSLCGFGAYLLCQREARQRWLGLGVIVLGATSFALIMKVLYPLFRHGEGTMYFLKYYGHLGASMSDVVKTSLTRPAYVLTQTLLQPMKLEYLAAVFLPFVLFPLRRPVFLLPVLPAILINILSNDPHLLSRTYHYEAEIYPALFATGVIALTHNARYRALWLAVLLVAFTPRSPTGVARSNRVTAEHLKLKAQLDAHVPRDRAIAAPQRIATHLTDREKLYMFDYLGMEEDWRRADVVVIAAPGTDMGFYLWDTFIESVFPKMQSGLRLLFEDPEDPRFRLYETTAPKTSLPAQPSWPPQPSP
jgi:uncharacterized membrane protein